VSKQGNFQPKIAVFAANLQSQYVLSFLLTNNYLVGVIVPDPNELGTLAVETHGFIAQLQKSNIPFQCCSRDALPSIAQQLDTWQVNLGIIFGYPHILPVSLLSYFSTNIFNFHASDLPEYKGPQPLYWQIRNREVQTALTLHRAEARVDSGNIVVQHYCDIKALDTLGSLHNRIATEAPLVIAELVDSLVKTNKVPKDSPQASSEKIRQVSSSCKLGLKYARRPSQKDLSVDFNQQTAKELSAMCRAGNGLPYSAIIYRKNMLVNLIEVTAVDYPNYGTKPGTVIHIGEPEGIIVSTKDGSVRLDILACADGIFSGMSFAEYFNLDAGELLNSTHSSIYQQHA